MLVSSVAPPGCVAPCSLGLPSELEGPACVSVNGAWQITEDCVDPQYSRPVIDSEVDEIVPVPHLRVSGHFDGTAIDFNVYLPKKGWKGHFFQILYPLQNSTSPDSDIGFGAESGGYTVRATGRPSFRGDAAAAKVSMMIAREYYKPKFPKIHGYIYGGSGGSLLTIGAMENTVDVWSGAVTLIMASPASTPNNWSIRALAGLVLGDKKQKIQDAVAPGGSGDPFTVLNSFEKSAMEEALALGIPLHTWEDFEAVGAGDGLWEFVRGTGGNAVRSQDPAYFDDFWTKPGYAGTDKGKLGKLFRKELIDYTTSIKSISRGANNMPVQLTLNKAPKTARAYWLDLTIISSSGKVIGTIQAKGASNSNSKVIDLHPDNDAAVIDQLDKGLKVLVDNRAFLAMHGYHRHQLPSREGFYGYDYLRTADGSPVYPQRDVLVAPTMSRSASGGATHSGKFNGKMIIMDNLMDYDAFPWHADWYNTQIHKAYGNLADSKVRLHFSENADHYMGGVLTSKSARLLDFTGLYEQHLQDLSAWVEKGTEPPAQTRYTVNDSQIQLPGRASERKGIQPVVDMTANGGRRAEVRSGATVAFKLTAEVPPGAGKIVSVEWDFEGNGNYVKRSFGQVSSRVETTVSYKYSRAGTRYAAVRVGSRRDGRTDTTYAVAANLGRARIIVR
ncbi:hypothetical protein EDB80DRAFT_817952 [Ilyonectria destructans]|nr:hypothetical protein EDB80DRAFT_817952 [Ilyonectria destructans]